MVVIKHVRPSPKTITNILTLRYNPAAKPLIKKLTWKDFTEKQSSHSTDFIEKTIQNYFKKNIKNSKKTRVSIALSGGIDSTLLLALLRKTFPDISIDAISIKFADSTDESEQAKIIARKFNANHHIFYLENFLEKLPKSLSIVKLPFWDLHWVYVAEKAKSFSNILVSGDGGDELFGGYTFRYKKFLSLIKSNSNPTEKVKAYLNCHERDWVPDQEKVFAKRSQFSWKKIYEFLEKYFDNPLQPISQVFLADFNGKLLYNWIPLYTKIHQHFHVQQVSPLLSSDMISFATHLPIQIKYDANKNIGKLLLHKLLKKYVSGKLLTKKKQGFSVNTINLWKSHGLDLCKYYLSDARIINDGWINGEWLKSRLEKLEKEPDVRYVNKFLGLLAFEIWYRLFITKEINAKTVL